MINMNLVYFRRPFRQGCAAEWLCSESLGADPTAGIPPTADRKAVGLPGGRRHGSVHAVEAVVSAYERRTAGSSVPPTIRAFLGHVGGPGYGTSHGHFRQQRPYDRRHLQRKLPRLQRCRHSVRIWRGPAWSCFTDVHSQRLRLSSQRNLLGGEKRIYRLGQADSTSHQHQGLDDGGSQRRPHSVSSHTNGLSALAQRIENVHVPLRVPDKGQRLPSGKIDILHTKKFDVVYGIYSLDYCIKKFYFFFYFLQVRLLPLAFYSCCSLTSEFINEGKFSCIIYSQK